MTIPLAKTADLEQVEALRPRVHGRACVVVGSAPLPSPPPRVQMDEVLIAVNGGIASCPFRTAQIWVLNSKAQDRPGSPQLHEMHRLMLEQAHRSATDHLLLLRGPKVASEAETLEALRIRRATWRTWSVLDKPTKLFVEQLLCDRVDPKEPCSSGVLAAACALYCGASSVRLVGFSWVPGYAYLPKARPQKWWRNHLQSDRKAIAALRSRYGALLSGDFVDAAAVAAEAVAS